MDSQREYVQDAYIGSLQLFVAPLNDACSIFVIILLSCSLRFSRARLKMVLHAIRVAEYESAATTDKSTADCFASKYPTLSTGWQNALARENAIFRVAITRQVAVKSMFHCDNVYYARRTSNRRINRQCLGQQHTRLQHNPKSRCAP